MTELEKLEQKLIDRRQELNEYINRHGKDINTDREVVAHVRGKIQAYTEVISDVDILIEKE